MLTTALDPRNRFRSTHASKRLVLAGRRWDYFSGGHGPRGLLVLGGALSFGDSSHRLIGTFESSRRVISPSQRRQRTQLQTEALRGKQFAIMQSSAPK